MAKPKTVRAETEASIAAASLDPRDAGVAQVLVELADQVDFLLGNEWLSPAGKFDNVTVPTYLKYAESLGLTPAARARMKLEEKAEAAPSTLGKMRLAHGSRKSA